MGGGGARTALRDQWYTKAPLPEGTGSRYNTVLVCKTCNQELPWADPSKPHRAKRYHWPHGPVCQGLIAEAHGVRNVVGLPVMVMFGNNPHYGKIVYERADFMRAGRRAAGDLWRVQFEDSEEYDLAWDEVSDGLQGFVELPPTHEDGGLIRDIEIPLDRGEAGIPGLVFGNTRGQPDTQSDDEDDMPGLRSGSDSDSDEEEVAEYDFYEDDDELPEFTDRDNWYFNQLLPGDSPVNYFTHIIESVEQRKGNRSNKSVIEGFNLQQKNFRIKLPQSWDTLKRMLVVPELDSKIRHMCINGDYVWPYLSKNRYESRPEDEQCPRCGARRFYRRSGNLTPQRVLWYLGLPEVMADFFKDPEWDAAWKQHLDISNGGIWGSKHVARMNDFFNQRVLEPHSGLYEAFDDGFTMCTNGTNGITLFGVQSHDVAATYIGKEINRRPFMVVGPPEPSNTSLLLDEFVKEANSLMTSGVTVKHLGQTIQYTPFLVGWMADAMARAKLLGIGGPGKLISCGNCWQHSSFLLGTKWYPAGYAKAILRWTTEGGGRYLELYAGLTACCLPAYPPCWPGLPNLLNSAASCPE